MDTTQLMPLIKYLQSHLRASSAQADPRIALMHGKDAMRTAEEIAALVKAEVETLAADAALGKKPAAKPAAKTPAKPAAAKT